MRMIFKNIYWLVLTGAFFTTVPTVLYAATLSLTPASGSFAVRETFSLDIVIDTEGAATDGVDVHFLRYNPSLLEVQDADANTSGIQIQPGSLYADTTINIVDQTAGAIDFSQITSGGSTFAGSGTLATITFKVLAEGNDTVSFDFTLGDTTDSNISSQGADVLSAVVNGSYSFSGSTPTPTPPPDSTPPARISDLSYNSVTESAITLSWTAVGDDGDIGTATGYDIRYSSSVLSEANWNDALQAEGEPTPKPAGSSETFTLSGLSGGTTYYIGIKAVDDASNFSELSNVVSVSTAGSSGGGSAGGGTSGGTGGGSTGGGGSVGGGSPDRFAPAMPTNFTALAEVSNISLSWQNPGDSDFSGVLLVRKERILPASRFDGKLVFQGNAEQYVDQDVLPSVDYYYALFAYDNSLNYSLPATVGPVNIGSGQFVGQQPNNVVYPQSTPTPVSTPQVSQPSLQCLAPALTRTLYRGVKSQEVLMLQRFLNSQGFMLAASGDGSPGKETELYGFLTMKAVQRFQCAHNIVCQGDEASTGFGVVGPKTRAKLNELMAAAGSSFCPTQRSAIKKPLFTRSLYRGVRREDVRELQKVLNSFGFLVARQGDGSPGKETDFYGDLTMKAVQRFQCAHNIVCQGDEASTGFGVVGPKTRAKLNELISKASQPVVTPSISVQIQSIQQRIQEIQEKINQLKQMMNR